MIKALGSRVNLFAQDNILAASFYACVEDLIENEHVLRLSGYKQHMDVSRYQHSINVSYYSFILCKRLGLDCRAAARGGLLHDLFFYRWQDEDFLKNYTSKRKAATGHLREHPITALYNASLIADLTDVEQDIILKHMWPTTRIFPKYRETIVVSMVDKMAATCEFLKYLGTRTRVAFKRLSSLCII